MTHSVLRITFAVLLPLCFAACGATSHQVASRPPKIELGSKPYAVEFGTLSPKNISLFFWPDEYNEAQMEVAARTVKLAANQLDSITTKEAGFLMAEGAFQKLQCLQQFATATVVQPGADLPWVTTLEDTRCGFARCTRA